MAIILVNEFLTLSPPFKRVVSIDRIAALQFWPQLYILFGLNDALCYANRTTPVIFVEK